MLFSSVRESIKPTPSPDAYTESTLVDYNLAWTSDETNNENFDRTVSAFSGPRMGFCIPSTDPIWNIILEGGVISLTFNDFTMPLDGNVYAKKILTDFMLYPTDVVGRNMYQGSSELAVFETGKPVTRTLSLARNPLPSNQVESYVQTVRSATGKSPSGEEDIYSFQLERGVTSRQLITRNSKNLETFTSSKSILGTVLDTVADIDTNYDLQDGWQGKKLPQGDLLSFLTASQYATFINTVPQNIILDTFAGVYNNIKVFPVKLSDAEKTYLTNARLTGTDLNSQRVQTTTLSPARYYSAKYADKLYRRR